MNIRSKKGFTLVEIMIVVVIIALLAAMAIPAFQKVRQNSIKSTMDNDAKQLASAANQYYMEYAASVVHSSILVGTSAGNYIPALSRGNSVSGGNPLSIGNTFSLSNRLVGQLTYRVDAGANK